MPWRRRLWLYRHGFLSSKDAIWTLTDDTIAEYLSDFQGLDSKIRGVTSPYDTCLENKVLFPLIVSPTHGDLIPTVYGLVKGENIESIGFMDEVRSFDELVELLDDRKIVAKPPDTSQGDGVKIMEKRGDDLWINDEVLTRDEFVDDLRKASPLVLQEYVSQATYAEEIFPGSVNTVRIITMVDPDSGEPFIAAAMHRFGTSSSNYIDNASSGGISAGIEVDSGVLTEALVPGEEDGSRWRWMKSHPDTGSQIVATELPHWERVKSQIRDLAATYGTLWPLAAWDVVIQEDGQSITVLEGNANVGTKFIQAHQPLLEAERVRRFFEYHGVI